MNFDSVRAVLFDVDGTLYDQRRLRALMALELATLPLLGPFRASRRLSALRAFRDAQERLRGIEHANPAMAQIAEAARASGLPVADVEAVVDEWMQRRPLKYLRFCRAPGLERLLRGIDAAGLRAGVLSDYPAEAKLHALGLGGRFHPVLSAADPGVSAFKPSPRGYLRACEVWGVRPVEVLFVGDRADVDAVGAAAAGMPCVIVGRRRPGTGIPDSCTLLPSLDRLSHLLRRD